MAKYEERRVPEDREKVVVEKDKSGPGGVIAAVIGLIVLLLIIWAVFALFDTADDATNGGADVDIAPQQENTTETTPDNTGGSTGTESGDTTQ